MAGVCWLTLMGKQLLVSAPILNSDWTCIQQLLLVLNSIIVALSVEIIQLIAERHQTIARLMFNRCNAQVGDFWKS